MRSSRPPALAVLLAGMLLAGCRGDTDTPPSSSGTPSTPSGTSTTSASPSPSPSETSTLTAAQERAFREATDVVLAFRQTITDLYSGARTRINDLDNVVTGDKLDRERNNVQKGLVSGRRSEPRGVQLVLVSAEPVKINLKTNPPTVVVRACIDATAVTDIDQDGRESQGIRERLDYEVVKTTYLPDPGWAVKEVTGDKDAEDRTC